MNIMIKKTVKRNILTVTILGLIGQPGVVSAADALTSTTSTSGANAADPAAASTQQVSSELDTVEVPGLSVGRGAPVNKMDVNATILTREQIDASPELFVDQLINKEMGIYIPPIPANQSDPTGGTSVVAMRGFSNANGEKVLVMVDGVPINDGFFRTIDWNLVPRETIERIEIVRGGGAASLWGNLAEGGVINIITREPEKGEKRIGFKYGSFDTKVGNAVATLYHDESLKVGANFNTTYSNGYNMTPAYAPYGIQLRNQFSVPAGSQTNNLLLSTYFTPAEGSKYYIKLNGHEILNNGVTTANSANQWYKFDYRGGGQTKYSDTGSVNLSTFWNYSGMNKQNGGYVSNTFNSFATSTVSSSFNNLTAQQALSQVESMPYQTGGGSAFVEEALDFGEFGRIVDIKGGLDVRGTTIQDNNTLYGFANGATNIKNASGLATGVATYATGYYNTGFVHTGARNMFEGLFLQGNYKPVDALDLTLGLREDFWQAYNGNTTKAFYNPNGSSAGVTTQALPSTYFTQFNPRFGAKWSFDSGFDLRATIYRNYAAPGMNNLYRSYFSPSSANMSNANLVPESNFGQEVGFDFVNDTLRVGFTLFHNQLQNFITSVTMCQNGSNGKAANGYQQCGVGSNAWSVYGIPQTTGSYSVGQNQNVGTAVMMGGEFEVNWKAHERIDLNFGITRLVSYMSGYNQLFGALNASIVNAGGLSPLALHTQLPNTQPLTITAGGKVDFVDWVPGLTFNWILKSWPTFYNSTQQLNGCQTINGTLVCGQQQLSAATTGDVMLNYQATKEIGINVSVQNIGNKYYLAAAPGTSSSSAPSLGMPFNVMGGINVNW